MQWDLQLSGVMTLLAMSAGFGLLAQVLFGRHTSGWMWLIGGVSFFVFGLMISEWWFGWATEEELQPNYGGLSFDETLLALLPSVVVVFVARHLLRRHHDGDPGAAGRDLPVGSVNPRRQP